MEGPAVNATCAPESGVNPDLSLGSKPQFGQVCLNLAQDASPGNTSQNAPVPGGTAETGEKSGDMIPIHRREGSFAAIVQAGTALTTLYRRIYVWSSISQGG